MIQPILNRNGSSVEDLVDPRLQATEHLNRALAALSNALPHGRDYPKADITFARDRREHAERVYNLTLLRDIIYEEAIYIKRQGEKNG